MVFVVLPRPKWMKPSLLAGMPADSFGKFSTNGKGTTPSPQAAAPKGDAVRSEPYLRLVAARPCKNCGRQKHSQAAHLPPEGKAIKQDDRETFPLCADAPRRKGCHPKFDNYELMPHDKAVKQGRKWARETRAEIEAEGLWPKSVPKWPKRGKAAR